MSSRRRALALIFGALLVALTAGAGTAVYLSRQNLIADLDDEIAVSLEATSTFLENFDLDLFSDIEATTRTEALIVIGPDGEVLASLPAGPPANPLPPPKFVPNRAAAEVGRFFSVDGTRGGPSYRIGVATVGGTGNLVVIARPLDDVQDTLATLRRTLAATTAVVILVLGVLTWLILRASLRPFEEMIDTAQTIAAGDYSRRADVAGTADETRRLSNALNIMLDKVQEAFEIREASEARVKRFASDASHELRTPLTTVRGYSELYLSGAATDAESVTKQMTRINAEAKRMGGLVDELLLLARLDQRLGLADDRVDLVEVVQDAISDARVIDPSRPIDLTARASELIVSGDRDRLYQVLTNLLTNVRDHTPADSPVEIHVSRSPGVARVSVKDHGPGMEPEVAEQAFERFFRAERSRGRIGGGSGLGLSIVASIVEAHDGSISAKSTPGEGSTFTIELPLASDSVADIDSAFPGDPPRKL